MELNKHHNTTNSKVFFYPNHWKFNTSTHKEWHFQARDELKYLMMMDPDRKLANIY